MGSPLPFTLTRRVMLVSSHASMAKVLPDSATLPRSSPISADPGQTRPGNDLAYNKYSYTHTSLDTHIVIITGALLFLLTSILCINFAIRYVLRRWYLYTQRRAEDAESGSAAARKTNTGMKKSQVRGLPTMVYTGSKAEAAAQEENASSSQQCPICLLDFADGERIRVLPKCRHSFHVRCIDTWLSKHSSCPTCRSDLMEAIEGEKTSTQVQVLIAITSTPQGALSPSLSSKVATSF